MKLCGFDIGLDRPFFLIAGPCVLEGEQMAVDIASAMKEITDELGIPYLFKASYDKANRTSAHSFRGPGMDEGLRILAAVREKVGVPVLTDVHTEAEVPVVASVVDMLQTPAFLCRQTDFIRACAVSGKPVNIKKGQFLAPGDMLNVVEKAREAAPTSSRSASAAPRSVTATSCPTCEALRSCARRWLPWSSTPHIPCSFPVATARAPAVSASSFPCSRELRSQRASPASSWKPIRRPPPPRATVPTSFRSAACVSSSRALWRSTAS